MMQSPVRWETIWNLLDADPVEDGVMHPAENLVAKALREPAGSIILQQIIEVGDPYFAASLLRLAGRVGQPSCRRGDVIGAALTSPDIRLRDAAIEAVEQWGDTSLLPLLKTHVEPDDMIREYRDAVVSDLS